MKEVMESIYTIPYCLGKITLDEVPPEFHRVCLRAKQELDNFKTRRKNQIPEPRGKFSGTDREFIERS